MGTRSCGTDRVDFPSLSILIGRVHLPHVHIVGVVEVSPTKCTTVFDFLSFRGFGPCKMENDVRLSHRYYVSPFLAFSQATNTTPHHLHHHHIK